MNKNILVCVQNGLVADGIMSLITKQNAHVKVSQERSVDLFGSIATINSPDVVVVEAKKNSPYTISEWKERIHELRNDIPDCRFAVIVDDENLPEITELVKAEKSSGEIDAFFYSSSGLNYLVDAIASL